MGAATVPKFVLSLALDFPVICLQFFMGNFSQQEEKSFTNNTVYFHAVTYPSRWPPKPVTIPSNQRPLRNVSVFVNKSPHSAKRPYSKIILE